MALTLQLMLPHIANALPLLDPRFSHLMVDFVHSSNNGLYLQSPVKMAESVSERDDKLLLEPQYLPYRIGSKYFLPLGKNISLSLVFRSLRLVIYAKINIFVKIRL
jgi:hypothetical protein